MNKVFLAIGSNISPREKTITRCLSTLQSCFPKSFQYSSLFLTKPYCSLDQKDYFNCCVSFESDLSPRELLAKTSRIETQLGRKRTKEKWGSRTIDIDILLVGDQIVSEQDLIIPHYDLENRDFFLLPLLELDTSLCHPKSRKAISVLLDSIPTKKRTFPSRRYKPDLKDF